MKSITVARNSLKPQANSPLSPDSLGAWSSEDLQYARARSAGWTGNRVYGRAPAKVYYGSSVYVRGYYRQNGAYVPHVHSPPRGHRR